MTLVALAVAWLMGIAMVAAWQAPWWMAAATLCALLPAAFSGWLPVRPGLLAAAVVTALAGGAIFQNWASQPPPGLASFVGQDLDIEGEVSSLPELRLTTAQVAVRAKRVNAVETAGSLLVTTSQYSSLLPGDQVRVRGRLDEAPVFEDFDYRGYLARQGIVGTMFLPSIEVDGHSAGFGRSVATVRRNLESVMLRALPEPEASLATGITLGRDSTIPRDLYDDYRRSGLAHIIAVSGANVAILAGFVFVVASPIVGMRFAVFPAAVFVFGYVFLAGATETVVRAGIMSFVLLFVLWQGRQQSGLSALGAAAILMTAGKPSLAVSVGFQLSLAATAAIIVFGPWFYSWTYRGLARIGMERIVPRWLQFVLAITLAAWIGTLPLLWGTFGEISLVSPLANLVVEPIFAFAFVLSLLVGFAGAVWEPAGLVLGWAAYYPLAICNEAARTFGGLPFASVSAPRLGATWIIAMYVALAIPGWFCYRYLAPEVEPVPLRPRERQRQRLVAAAAAGCAFAIVFVHSIVPIRGDGELSVTMLNVGQGDAIFVRTPGGTQILVDGGPSGLVLARELGALMPHWDRSIDVLLLSHPEQDHLGGFPAVLDRFRVGESFDNGRDRSTEAASLYARHAPNRTRLEAGDSLEFDGVRLDVLWPHPGYATTNENNASLVVLVTYGQTRFLLTGDIERPPQRTLALEIPTATVLKVPHHGAATSEAAFFGAAAAPIALISAGEGNRFGHPTPATLAMLDGAIVLRTDIHGRITVKSNGQRIEFATQR